MKKTVNVITREVLYRSPKSEVIRLRDELRIEKMKLDKFFSVFLDYAHMDDKDTNTPEWILYREMSKNYEEVNELIRTANYRINYA